MLGTLGGGRWFKSVATVTLENRGVMADEQVLEERTLEDEMLVSGGLP
jgi:hypothetical protein